MGEDRVGALEMEPRPWDMKEAQECSMGVRGTARNSSWTCQKSLDGLGHRGGSLRLGARPSPGALTCFLHGALSHSWSWGSFWGFLFQSTTAGHPPVTGALARGVGLGTLSRVSWWNMGPVSCYQLEATMCDRQ